MTLTWKLPSLTGKLPSLTGKLPWLLLLSCLLVATCETPAFAHGRLERENPLVMMVLQEANGQPFQGMVAVAAVALDRVKDPRWPNKLDDVIYQRKQFSGMSHHVRRGDYTEREIRKAVLATFEAYASSRPCGFEVFWYHADYIDLPIWARDQMQMTPACHIGSHIFYRHVRSESDDDVQPHG